MGSRISTNRITSSGNGTVDIGRKYVGARVQLAPGGSSTCMPERDMGNAALDDKSLPLQYSRYFLEEIGSFNFLLRSRPSDIV